MNARCERRRTLSRWLYKIAVFGDINRWRFCSSDECAMPRRRIVQFLFACKTQMKSSSSSFLSTTTTSSSSAAASLHIYSLLPPAPLPPAPFSTPIPPTPLSSPLPLPPPSPPRPSCALDSGPFPLPSLSPLEVESSSSSPEEGLAPELLLFLLLFSVRQAHK